MSTATSPVKVNGGGPAPETSSLASASAPAASASASAPAGVGSAASSLSSAGARPAEMAAPTAEQIRAAGRFNDSIYNNNVGWGKNFDFIDNGDGTGTVRDNRWTGSETIHERATQAWNEHLAAKKCVKDHAQNKKEIAAWDKEHAAAPVTKTDATKDATKADATKDADKTAKKDEKKDESGWCSYLWNGVTSFFGSIGRAVWYVITCGPCVDFFSWLCGSSEKKDATTASKDATKPAGTPAADASKPAATKPATAPATK